ncbi:MAG: thermopsin family protease [Thermoproteus sp. AZ2]|uniref:Thermopsin family protease n=1 Tax=Thermoproteus sp. AZ2 TaxID=1609232 RepID=A0ACC6V0A6_9CREN
MRFAPALLLLSALAFACYTAVIPIDGNYTLYLQGPRYAEWNGSLLVYRGGLVAALHGPGSGVLWGNGTYTLAGKGELGLLVCSGFAVPSAEGPGPLGVVDYGVADLWGAEAFFTQRAEAVVGCFNLTSPLIIGSGPLGAAPAYSIQLNAYVEVGGRLYWAQALVRYFNGSFNFLDNLWNFTGPSSTLYGVVGSGVVAYYGRDMYYYYERGLAPLSSACLTISARSADGAALAFFYLNNTLMDEVRIPDAGEPRIVVEPEYSPRGLPIDLELVVGGYGSSYPDAKLLGGNISLALYLVSGGVAEPPLAAWSAGASTRERIYASVTPAGRGAVVGAGRPLQAQLYADLCVYFLNGTANCGGEKRYLVSLVLPNGTKAFWAAPGANISIPIIYAGRIRYIPMQPISIEVDKPAEITPSYAAQYEVVVRGLGRSWELWANADSP